MRKHRTALIMAGGKGLRMNAPIPKQFIELSGKPVLMHTLEVFRKFDPEIKLILVLPADQINYWNELCEKFSFDIKHRIAKGGETRFHSVKNGLELLILPSIVAVHDAVRPLVSVETIQRCFDEAEKHNAVIPVTELNDSIREVQGDDSKAADRSKFRLVQTPQVFDGELLVNAYWQEFSSFFTDDASVVESTGVKIHLVQGNRENIKITTETDLVFAEMILRKNNTTTTQFYDKS